MASVMNSDNLNSKSNELECSICFESAQQPVVSYCGHVFCWPCLYRWMEVQTNSNAFAESTCPVCKAIISKDKLVPIYGRDSNVSDPRNSIPPRPAGQYSEATQYNQISFSFPESNTIMASASFHISGLGLRAALGPLMSNNNGENSSNGNNMINVNGNNGGIGNSNGSMSSDLTEFNLGQFFIGEMLKNIFFTLSILTFIFMLII